MRTTITAILALFFTIHLLGQDSTSKKKLIVGVYANEKEFLAREPSITKPFKIVPNIDISFNETDSRMDTTETGITYQYLDSTQKHKNAFGFCDGTDIYLGCNKYGYDKVDFIGRFSFINSDYNFGRGGFAKILVVPIPFLLNDAMSSRVKSKPKKYLFFVDKSGNLHEATGQAIGWLIKDDKDILKEFNAEKKYNNEVFKKYLIKMNDRYPES